jgi:acyl-CoA dehydrogenase
MPNFRAETRAWLTANCPPEMRQPMRGEEDQCWGGRRWKFQSEAQKVWLDRMVAKGWTVPEWPRDCGGAALSRDEGKILREEMVALGARIPLENFGIRMLGPVLLKFGSQAQRLEHLPPIARGEIRWCQGYSEPNAGSDLASLQTKCEDMSLKGGGDHWLVNGQKIWTTWAHLADKIFCLVRTDPTAKKHLGISFLIFDMAIPGVTVRPIVLISGRSHFCETFLENVKVPKDGLVGTLNRGWDVAKYLLTHERETSPGVRAAAHAPSLSKLAQEIDGTEGQPIADPELRREIAQLDIDGWGLALTMERLRDEAQSGQGIGTGSSLLKYYGAELEKRRQEIKMQLLGADGLEWESDRSHDGKHARDWLRSKAGSIAGGTSEINLNILAKNVLKLPSA